MKTVLRYFPARGRAQPLRHALADANIGYEDVRVPLRDWRGIREDRAVSGFFASLPTLSWGEDVVAETLPIASFMARQLGHCEGLDAAAIARLEAICSLCYVDVTTKFGELLWLDVLHPGADPVSSAPRTLGRILDKLHRLDQLMPEPGGWLGGTRPVVADFFAAEAFEVMRYLFDTGSDAALSVRLPRLCAHADAVRARPSLEREWERRPPNHTARPDEQAVLARLRTLDSSSLGL